VLENVPALDVYNNNNNNTYTLLNTITNNPLILKHGLKDLLDWVKDSYIERDINLVLYINSYLILAHQSM